MNGAFWPVIGTLGDHPVRPGCQSIPKCISRAPGRARARAHMHPRQGLSPASRERPYPASDPARHVRAHARPAVCTRAWRFRCATSLSVPSHAPALGAPGRLRVRAANEISRLPIGRARHLCASIRDRARGHACPCALGPSGAKRARACVSVLPSMRVRAVAHPCASCMRAVVLAPVCVSPYAIARGCETHPRKGALVIALEGLRGMRARRMRERAREAGVPDRAAAEFRAPRANSCPAYGRGGPIRRAAPQVSPHAPVWGVGLFAYLIGVRHRLGRRSATLCSSVGRMRIESELYASGSSRIRVGPRRDTQGRAPAPRAPSRPRYLAWVCASRFGAQAPAHRLCAKAAHTHHGARRA